MDSLFVKNKALSSKCHRLPAFHHHQGAFSDHDGVFILTSLFQQVDQPSHLGMDEIAHRPNKRLSPSGGRGPSFQGLGTGRGWHILPDDLFIF